MDTNLPRALINGIDVFGAKKLAEELLKKDLVVFGVGEYVDDLGENKNFRFLNNIDQAEEARYVFDYLGDELIASKAKEWGARLTIVKTNDTVVDSRLEIGDWRIVEGHGVYGEGMSENNDETKWLVEAIKQAVQNKNLELPMRSQKFRLLSLDDLTESILRASLLSGTGGQVYEIWGNEVGSDEVAKMLIEDAKMTRYKVIEKEVKNQNPKEGIEQEWKKLRWQPIGDLEEGMKGALQYFFTKADEENRTKRKPEIKEIKREDIIEEPAVAEALAGEKRVRYEAVVEEERSKRSAPTVELEIEPEVEETIVEEIELHVPEKTKEIENEIVDDVEEIEEEPFEEIKPLIKNKENFWERKARELEKKNDKLLITNDQLEEKKETKIEKHEIKLKKQKKKFNLKLGWVAGGLLVGAVLMVLWGIWGQYSLVQKTYGLEKLIKAKKYDEVVSNVKIVQSGVLESQNKLSDWGLNSFYWGRNYQSILRLWNEGLILVDKLVVTAKISDLMGGAVFNGKEIDWTKQLNGLKDNLTDVDGEMGVLQARMSGDWTWLPAIVKSKWQIVKNDLEENKSMVDLGLKTMDLWPDFLGLDGKKRDYLVLLQNENELRPGGGFIGSYGILSFSGGKLVDFEVKDVYEADGQLQGHVEPPQPIKDYLKEGGWYMRDANWNADFTLAAKDIQWFFEKETGRKVDGVIGVNLSVARALLGAVGEVYVPDFKAKINKDNLYEQAEYYSEKNSFAGSTQKSSFLGGLGKQLFEEIKNLDTKGRLELVRAMFGQLESNEIRMALNNQDSAKVVASLGWNGAIYRGVCAKERCFADYLYLVEANLGVNKANYFLYRNIEQVVEVSNQSIARSVKINYENTAKNTTWPGGDYVNYLRAYIPESANLVEVSVTDPAGVKTVFGGDQLKVNDVAGKKEIGLLVTVPVRSKRVVEIKYNNQIDLTGGGKFSYLNYIQKQSGYGDTGLVTLMSIPADWQVDQVEPEANMVNGKLLFNQKLNKDIKMGVEISK